MSLAISFVAIVEQVAVTDLQPPVDNYTTQNFNCTTHLRGVLHR